MKFSDHFNTLAHAYVIEGNAVQAETELLGILESDHSIVLHGNPDFLLRRYTLLSVEDAREIVELASRRKVSEGKRAFVITADGITREASNAFLKTLEEPSEGTHFFIILPSAKRVLPTILSRVRLVVHSSAADSAVSEAETFLSLSPAARIGYVKDLLARLDKEEMSRADIISLIEQIARQKHKEHISTNVLNVASYATDQSASLKMILEYLALA